MSLRRRTLIQWLCAAWTCEAAANPNGMTVVAGSATAQTSGSHLNITAGNGAVVHWNSFNIKPGETTSFIQPSANSIVLNTIGGTSPSQIWGHLTANGTVILANAFGFYFGPNSMIKVGGHFIATTAPLPPDFGAGSTWQFTVPPPSASIVNYGEIQAGQGHSLFLISEQIENHGTLAAPGGNVGLYAGKEVLVSERADGRGLSATVKLPSGSIDNTGSILATPGEIAMRTQVVNQGGAVHADAVRTQNGVIELVASDITLGASAGAGVMNVNTAFKGASAITLEASGNITLNANTTWNLSTSSGNTSGQLTLAAGNNIVFNNNSQITDANNWSVSLQAGANIFLNGGAGKTFNGTVQTALGDVSMTAGQSILVATGAIRTTGGGDISLKAVAGDINAGTKNDGYQFSITGYTPTAALGQIATAAGGNVTLEAGNNIVSSPTVPSGQTPGATGAYGTSHGDVTLTAGNQILGNYIVANGTGTINAGNVGSSTRPVALSLVKGTWNVAATSDVFLSEIRNPNGSFNPSSLPVPALQYNGNLGAGVPGRTSFLFDYADNAAAHITAGNSITLVGANLPRLVDNQKMPPIYPPILSLDAGAGGVTVDNSIILFPSSRGALSITTHHGGDLAGQTQQSTLTGIIMSDSSLPGWSTFAQGHAATPLHLHDANPITLDISGNIDSFGLTAPTYAEIAVAGDTYNFGFQGRNLSPDQTTKIHVTGDISYRGDLTSVGLATPLPAILFNLLVSGNPEAAKKIRYNPKTQTLTYIGQMSQAEEAFLLAPYRIAVNPANGAIKNIPIPLTADQQAAIQQLFTASQTASLGDQGLALAGPGKFDITARGIDLGISGGISVLAPDAALAAISTRGADLTVGIDNNLEMTASKIANESYLGAIQLTAGGALDVGGELTSFGDPNAPKGIFSTSGGNVSVVATGDVNINGSRIAAYDGGNILVGSLNGSVNAGNGGSGYVGFQSLHLDRSGHLVALAATIPGSGIVSSTLPGSPAAAGNITINAPEGSLNAGHGGVMLIPYNGSARNGNMSILVNHDKFDAPILSGNIDSRGSGIINLGSGSTVLVAVNVYGVIVTLGSLNISAVHDVRATVFAGMGVTINAGGNVSGNVISGGAVDVSADDITAALMGNSVSASGNTADAAIGIPASNGASDNVKTTEDASNTLAKSGDTSSEDDDQKKKKKTITLAQKSGRVTVLLPAKKN